MGTIYLLALMGFAVFNAPALEARQSPYDKIVERNLFQLQAEVPRTQPPTPVEKRLLKVKLTGITTILKRTVAFITIEGTKSQPAESVMVVNGQMVNSIEVKSIDERAGVVRILNGEEIQILNFESAKSSLGQPDQGLIVPPQPSPPMPARTEATMTPEEQTALIELQRIKSQQEGDPTEAILPPTGIDL